MSERLCTYISRAAAAIVLINGLAVLVGWIADLPILKGGFWAGITVKTNTAVGQILIGAALLMHRRVVAGGGGSGAGGRARIAAQAMAAVAAVLGGLTLVEHITQWDLGIDQLLMHEAPGEYATSSPNRMGPPASLSFLLGGIALLLLHSKRGEARWRKDIASVLAIVIGLIAMLPVLGYLFGASELYGLARITGIALKTAVTLLIFAVGMLCATYGGRALTLLSSRSAGGVMMRRLLVPAILLPPLLAWLRTIGEAAGYYDTAFGRALLVISFIVIFAALIWINARQLDAVDVERGKASAARERLLDSERKARAEAEQASRLKDEFLATLSHELRTPLNAILGWSQLLRKRGSDEELEEGLAVIERNTKAQTQLVSDLLDMSRIASGKLRLEMSQIDLAAVVHDAIESVEPTARVRGVVIQSTMDAGIGPVCGDAGKLQQVLWNLLTNAVKFSRKGGTVHVAAERVGNNATLTVSDTGIGISPAFLPFVFDRFRQADGSITRRHGGLGIGLTIVKNIVEAHGGAVKAASAGEGKGATFTVVLPVPADRTTTPPRREEPPDANEADEDDGVLEDARA